MIHGGGIRCGHDDHDHAASSIVPFPRPYACFEHDGQRLCWQHFHGVAGCRAIRRELVLLGAILCDCPRGEELERAYLGHDFTLRSCQLLRRPDMLFAFASFALLIECDEHGHRDRSLASEDLHLGVVRQWLAEHHGLERLYMLRVNPDGRAPMFARSLATNGEPVWEPTSVGEDKMRQVLARLSPVIASGLADDRAWVDATFAPSDSGEPVVLDQMFF